MVGERDSKFYSELKQLNEDFIKYIQATQEKSPYYNFTPTLNDYIKQISDLERDYPAKPGFQVPSFNFGMFSSASSSTPLFGQTVGATNPPPFGASNETKPSFGAATETKSPFGAATGIKSPFGASTETKSPFSITTETKSPFGAPTESKPPVFGTKAETNQGDAEEEEEDDAPPPEPKIDRYEEPDAKYSARCKLYEKKKVNDESTFDLIAVGMLFVKPMGAPDKLQVIVRQEPDLLKIPFNEVVSSSIPVKILPKAVQMIFPQPSGGTKSIIAKVKNEAEAEALLNVLNSVRG